ncbi:cytochrome P450 724B1-like isoform X5 [Magnolia sinica]|uniref:cytochrome P450 724B1-like isoform X5 n=1 Tax=Magnolia sinica TaxID=86752 RepID=UPI002659ACB0|nr:cytochrome P450 724B1-like isoform X5 [Magnolia sinica]
MDGWFWSSAIVAFVGLIGLLLYLIISHFMPLYLKLGVAPKGSFGWPLVGETLSFLSPHASNTLGSFLQDHCNRYGKVFKSHLFCSPTVVSCDQELNNFILQNEEKLFQCSYPKPIHGILGTSSMLVVVGDTHKRLRSLALTLVSTTKSKPEYLNDIERIAIQIMDAWKDKKEVIFCEEARKARARISSTVKAIVEERRSKGENSAGNKKSDFLEILLSANSLSEDERVSFVLDSLLGGYETTSLLMALAVLFLGQSPAALQQLRSEHESIRNVKGKEEYLNWDDYKKMEFTQHVINEALRCGNIVKFVHRKALKDVRFKDYSIPCGWKVLPVFSAVHLDTSLHGSVLDFHPWRWENQSQSTCKIFTPFGGGPRFCPGSELAKVETAFFLHHLVLNFRWTTEGVDQPMAYPYVEFHRGMPLKVDRLG